MQVMTTPGRLGPSLATTLQAFRADREAIVTYTSGGKSYTLQAYGPNTVFCDSTNTAGGVNIC